MGVGEILSCLSDPAKDIFDHVFNWKDKIEALKGEMEDLTRKSEDVNIMVENARENSRKPLKQVEGWITDVIFLESKIKEMEAYLEKEGFGTGAGKSPNVCQGYNLSKQAMKHLIKAQDLNKKGDGFMDGKLAIESSAAESSGDHDKSQVSTDAVRQRQEAQWPIGSEVCPIRTGSWGGDGGKPFDLGDDPGRLLGIQIRHEGCIDSIAFLFEKNGIHKWTSVYGGPGGELVEIAFKEGEYLIGMSGHQGNYNGYFVIKSLTFEINISKYGPYGTESGYPFSTTRGQIVSFFGRSPPRGFLDAIGVYCIPIKK